MRNSAAIISRSSLQVAPNDTLDALLAINDEKQLKDIYGAKNVSWDTIYGVEGDFSMATVLYSGTPDNVVIEWRYPKTRTEVISVTHDCQYNTKTEKFDLDTRWLTRSGVRLGTPLTELVKMNGKDFVFLGFGWDYGGGVMDWKGGNFDKKNMFVNLGLEDVTPSMEKDYEQLMGDGEFLSSLPVAKKLNPRVFEIVLSKGE